MQAIILLGGKGTRLSRLFPDRPKALAPVAGQPFLARQLAWLSRGGVTDIHLAAGYMAERLLAWLSQAEAGSQRSKIRGRPGNNGKKSDKNKDRVFRVNASVLVDSPTDRWPLTRLRRRFAPGFGGQASGLLVSFSAEPVPLGTGGGLKFAEAYIRSDPFLVLNGDTLLPGLDVTMLKATHEQAHPLVSIAVTQIRETGRYGTIDFDTKHRIRAFREKTERQEGWVNGGVYLMDKKALALIQPGKEMSLETEFFPQLAARGQLLAFPVPQPLLDMGTPEGLAAMEYYFSRQAAKE